VGNGPQGLIQEIQVAVSDRYRFRHEVGGEVTVTLVASANPLTYGSGYTLTATVVHADGSGPVTQGRVTLLDASGGLVKAAVALNAQGQASWPMTGLEYLPGALTFVASYSGVPNVAKPGQGTLQVPLQAAGTTVAMEIPTSVALGQTVALNARVSPASATGTVVLEYREEGGTTWTQYGTPYAVANGLAQGTPWRADRTLTWRARFTPATAGFTGSQSAEVRMEATSIPTATTFTCAAVVNNGANLRLTAAVAPAGPGVIQWEYSTNGGGSWATWTTTAVDAAGNAVKDWPSNGPTSAWQWRARYVPAAGAAHLTSVSAPRAVDVLALTTKTLTHEASWGASWRGTGTKRTDTNDLYQGQFSSTNGNQRSACGFASRASAWSGWTITKVEVYVYAAHWGPDNGGTLILGSHNVASEPGAFPSKTHRQNVAWSTKTGGKWIDVTAWGKGFATDAIDGLTFGPGSSTATEYYGYLTGTGTNRPKVRITGQKWA
jgi:hypothetical protein